jgi:hypothetical protein
MAIHLADEPARIQPIFAEPEKFAAEVAVKVEDHGLQATGFGLRTMATGSRLTRSTKASLRQQSLAKNSRWFGLEVLKPRSPKPEAGSPRPEARSLKPEA